jgi:ABC-type uncharacterized transport system auxiliary subunit
MDKFIVAPEDQLVGLLQQIRWTTSEIELYEDALMRNLKLVLQVELAIEAGIACDIRPFEAKVAMFRRYLKTEIKAKKLAQANLKALLEAHPWLRTSDV